MEIHRHLMKLDGRIRLLCIREKKLGLLLHLIIIVYICINVIYLNMKMHERWDNLKWNKKWKIKYYINNLYEHFGNILIIIKKYGDIIHRIFWLSGNSNR